LKGGDSDALRRIKISRLPCEIASSGMAWLSLATCKTRSFGSLRPSQRFAKTWIFSAEAQSARARVRVTVKNSIIELEERLSEF